MGPLVRSTNLARPKPAGGRARRDTGIDKHPASQIEVFAPGPNYGDGPGVRGDFVGDTAHHGGANKAVYAFARSELDHWQTELGRDLRDGAFGENLTTEGIDLEADLIVNQQLRVGSALLEVSIPRQPCVTFARHMAVPQWVKRFTAHGRPGVYLRVVQPGVIRPGDAIEVLDSPPHGITMFDAFAASTDDAAAERVVAAQCLPPMYHDKLLARLAARPGQTSGR